MSTTSLQSAVLSATFYVNTCVVREYQPRLLSISTASQPALRISATKRAACRMRKPLRGKYCLFELPELTDISRKNRKCAVTRFFSHASVNAEREE